SLARVVEHGRTHRLGVFAAELEHVTDLDAARDLQRAPAVRRRIAFDDLADVGHARDARIAFPVRAAVMRTVAIAAADEVGDDRGAAVDDDRYRIRQADRPDEAGLRAGGRYDLGLARELGDVGQLGQLGGLDLVDLVIAAHA